MGTTRTSPLVCALCGRTSDNGQNWLKGEAGEEKITVFLHIENRDYPSAAYDICGEKCASEFLALWVDDRHYSPE